MNRPVVAGFLAVLGLTTAGPLSMPALVDAATAQTVAPAQKELADPFGPRRAVAEVLSEMRGHGGPVRAIMTLDDGRRIVTGGFDSAIIVWGVAPAAAMQVLQFHDSTAVNALTALPGGLFRVGRRGRAHRGVVRGGGATAARDERAQGADRGAGGVALMARCWRAPAWDHTIRLWRLADEARGGLDHRGP